MERVREAYQRSRPAHDLALVVVLRPVAGALELVVSLGPGHHAACITGAAEPGTGMQCECRQACYSLLRVADCRLHASATGQGSR